MIGIVGLMKQAQPTCLVNAFVVGLIGLCPATLVVCETASAKTKTKY